MKLQKLYLWWNKITCHPISSSVLLYFMLEFIQLYIDKNSILIFYFNMLKFIQLFYVIFWMLVPRCIHHYCSALCMSHTSEQWQGICCVYTNFSCFTTLICDGLILRSLWWWSNMADFACIYAHIWAAHCTMILPLI